MLCIDLATFISLCCGVLFHFLPWDRTESRFLHCGILKRWYRCVKSSSKSFIVFSKIDCIMLHNVVFEHGSGKVFTQVFIFEHTFCWNSQCSTILCCIGVQFCVFNFLNLLASVWFSHRVVIWCCLTHVKTLHKYFLNIIMNLIFNIKNSLECGNRSDDLVFRTGYNAYFCGSSWRCLLFIHLCLLLSGHFHVVTVSWK